MRIIAFILSIIVLSLSILPCADAGKNIKDGKAKSAIAHSSDQSDSEDHEDACTPFCHCTCCAGFSANASFPVSKSINFDCRKYFSSFITKDVIEISLPIWQPPQLIFNS